jgi:hypothetical protein
MQVNVYITRHAGQLKNKMLAVPETSIDVMPKALSGVVDSSEAMFQGVI